MVSVKDTKNVEFSIKNLESENEKATLKSNYSVSLEICIETNSICTLYFMYLKKFQINLNTNFQRIL